MYSRATHGEFFATPLHWRITLIVGKAVVIWRRYPLATTATTASSEPFVNVTLVRRYAVCGPE